MGMFTIGIVLSIKSVHMAYYQIVQFRYVKFTVCQLYLNKAFRISSKWLKMFLAATLFPKEMDEDS